MWLSSEYLFTTIIKLSAIVIAGIIQINDYFVRDKHITDIRTWVGWNQILTVGFVLNWGFWLFGTGQFIKINGWKAYRDSFLNKEAHFDLPALVFYSASAISISLLHLFTHGMEIFVEHVGSTASRIAPIVVALHFVIFICEYSSFTSQDPMKLKLAWEEENKRLKAILKTIEKLP